MRLICVAAPITSDNGCLIHFVPDKACIIIGLSVLYNRGQPFKQNLFSYVTGLARHQHE